MPSPEPSAGAGTTKTLPVAAVHVEAPCRRYCVPARPLPPVSAGVRCTVTAILCQAPSLSFVTVGAVVSMFTKPVRVASMLPTASTDQ